MQVIMFICDCCSRQFHPEKGERKDICRYCLLDASGELQKIWVKEFDPNDRTVVRF